MNFIRQKRDNIYQSLNINNLAATISLLEFQRSWTLHTHTNDKNNFCNKSTICRFFKLTQGNTLVGLTSILIDYHLVVCVSPECTVF